MSGAGVRAAVGLCAGVSLAAVASGCASRPEPAPTLPSREVSIELQTPDPSWSVEITEARLVRGEVWVVSELSRGEGPAAQVISSTRDRATVSAPADAPVQHFVLGKTWGWGDEDSDVRFIEERADLGEDFRAGLRVYP